MEFISILFILVLQFGFGFAKRNRCSHYYDGYFWCEGECCGDHTTRHCCDRQERNWVTMYIIIGIVSVLFILSIVFIFYVMKRRQMSRMRERQGLNPNPKPIPPTTYVVDLEQIRFNNNGHYVQSGTKGFPFQTGQSERHVIPSGQVGQSVMKFPSTHAIQSNTVQQHNSKQGQVLTSHPGQFNKTVSTSQTLKHGQSRKYGKRMDFAL